MAKRKKRIRFPKPAAMSLMHCRASTILSKKDKLRNRRSKIAKRQEKDS